MAYRALLVDDEPIILEGLRARFGALDRAAFPIEIIGTCGNGRDALAFLMERAVDILLCDIRMPLMDGLALMKAVREADLRTRIIVVSGYADFAYAQEAMRAGAVDYLLKPISAQPFQRALRIAMRAVDEQQASSAGDGELIERAMLAAMRRLKDREPERIAREMPELVHRLFGSDAARELPISALREAAREALDIMRGASEAAFRAVPDASFSPEDILDAVDADERLSAYFEQCVELGMKSGALSHGSVAAAVAFIDEMEEPLSLEEIARRFGYHPVHLSRLIKRQTGMGFSQYVNEARMERAKKLLTASELSITDIAHTAGFNDLAYFCRVFKRQCGMTPQEYRNRL